MNMKNEYEKQKVALVSNSSSTKIWKLRDMNKHLNSFGNRIWHWLNLLEEHPKFKPWASGCYFSVQVGGVYHVYIVFNHCIIYKAKILLVIAFSVFTLTLKTPKCTGVVAMGSQPTTLFTQFFFLFFKKKVWEKIKNNVCIFLFCLKLLFFIFFC
jgi:hypothetical protein